MMNNNMKRRSYTAPNAEVVCLAPSAPIASWNWDPSAGKNWGMNSWGKVTEEQIKNASVTGVLTWIEK